MVRPVDITMDPGLLRHCKDNITDSVMGPGICRASLKLGTTGDGPISWF